MAALEPPGNVARELALFRRRLFSALGEGSALAFPELLPLVFAVKPLGVQNAGRRALLARLLDEAWTGVRGRFRIEELVVEAGSLYARVEGPVADLAAALRGALDQTGLRLEERAPLAPALGVFLCRTAKADSALAAARELSPPKLSFGDASLLFLRFDFGPNPFAALSWRELLRSRRRTGAPARRPPAP